jgi:hypothetical protein
MGGAIAPSPVLAAAVVVEQAPGLDASAGDALAWRGTDAPWLAPYRTASAEETGTAADDAAAIPVGTAAAAGPTPEDADAPVIAARVAERVPPAESADTRSGVGLSEDILGWPATEPLVVDAGVLAEDPMAAP